MSARVFVLGTAAALLLVGYLSTCPSKSWSVWGAAQKRWDGVVTRSDAQTTELDAYMSPLWRPTRNFVHATLGDKYTDLPPVLSQAGGMSTKFMDPFAVFSLLEKAGFVGRGRPRSAVQIGGGKLGTNDATHKFVLKGWNALIMDAATGFEKDFRQNFKGPQDKVRPRCFISVCACLLTAVAGDAHRAHAGSVFVDSGARGEPGLPGRVLFPRRVAWLTRASP